MRRQNGFTLIELLVVVAIIGIIAGIAYPSYLKSMQKGRRVDGKQVITQAAQALERCYSTYGTYNNSNCPELTALTSGIVSPQKYYTITGDVAPTTYTVTATANTTNTATTNAVQANDSGCTVMSITETGKKTSGTATSASDTGSCW